MGMSMSPYGGMGVTPTMPTMMATPSPVSPAISINSAQAGAAAATAILAGRTGVTDGSNLAGLLSAGQTPVAPAADPQQMQQQLLQQTINNRVYIGNVPFGFSSEDLKKIFVVFGPIMSCQLLPSQDNPQQHRGYGFIEYATADAAKLAIETMNGFEVAGKQLKVNFATAMRSPGVGGASPAFGLPGTLPGTTPSTANPNALPTGISPLGASTASAVAPSPTLADGGFGASAPSGAEGGASSSSSCAAGGSSHNGSHSGSGADRSSSTAEDDEEEKPLPPLPTNIQSPVILLTNMVGPEEVDSELKDEVREECSKFGDVSEVEVHVVKGTVRIFVEFKSLAGAKEAIPSLHGRWFGGRQILANTYDQHLFHEEVFDA